VGKASAAAKMKIAPGNLGILQCVRFNAADKQFPFSLFPLRIPLHGSVKGDCSKDTSTQRGGYNN
jgi:hypothetical protein